MSKWIFFAPPPFPYHSHFPSLSPSVPHSLTPLFPYSLPPIPSLPQSPPSPYRLRDFALADYDSVLALWRSCEGIGLSESDTREAIAAYLVRNPGLSLVATDEAGVVVGAILGGHDGRRGYLHHLAVAPAHRGRGLGRSLVDATLGCLRRLGIQKCNIFLYADNAAGRAFWLREGWSAREDLAIMQKVIR